MTKTFFSHIFALSMTRKRNSIETVQTRISTTPVVLEYLDGLVDSGLYGKTPAEAAERLIARGIEEIVKEGTILSPRKRKDKQS